jgi:hypothetical protein
MSTRPCPCEVCVAVRQRKISAATTRVIGTRKVVSLDERDPRVVKRSRKLRS